MIVPTPVSNIRIVIGKRNRLLGDCLRELLMIYGHTVQALTADGEQLLHYVRTLKPHICIVGLDLKSIPGMEVCQRLAEKYPETHPLLFTERFEQRFLRPGELAHCKGFLMGDCSFEELLNCIKKLMNGERYITPALSQYADKNLMKLAATEEGRSPLTQREIEVLEMVGRGATMREIAGQLYISEATVNNHRHNICQKLKISGRNALLQYALTKE